MKEHLFRTNPILIYKNIDARVTDEALTVGIRDILVRFENIGLALPKEQIAAIEKIQRIRNRIEHHRYDHDERNDEMVIAEALKVVLFFVEFVLGERLGDDIGDDRVVEMQARVLDYDERLGLAEARIEQWMKKEWPHWNPIPDDRPEEFEGTLDCPKCRQSYFVIGYHEKPFCFYCNASIDGGACKHCGMTFLISRGCECGSHGPIPKNGD